MQAGCRLPRQLSGQEPGIPNSTVTETASTIIHDLVAAALNGVSDGDLLTLLGKALARAGLDVPTIEVACDVVDPERAQHVLRWRRKAGVTGEPITGEAVFRAMLKSGTATLRLEEDRELFAPLALGV